jgi:tRNA dimethylallyltransferase
VVEAPGADPELRSRLEEEAARDGREALHRRLAELDPESAAWIEKSDLVRIIRALEIHALTGQPASAWRKAHSFTEDRYPYRMAVLSPPREALYATINRRTEAMFDAGLVDEVRDLVARGYREAAPMGSVGYVQALALAEGRLSCEEAIAQAAQMTRKYAKRQWTWFRKEPGAVECDPAEFDRVTAGWGTGAE